MLTLYTSGSKYSRRRCESVVTYFYNKYLSRYKIEIKVLHRGLLREGVYGWESVTGPVLRPRSFLIEIHNRLNKDNYIKVLMHEMTHVYQHLRGDLRDIGCLRLWKGIDCTELDYEELPWEQEAHQREEELYEDYLNHLTTL